MNKWELIRQIKYCYAQLGKNIGTTYLLDMTYWDLLDLLDSLLNGDSTAESKESK